MAVFVFEQKGVLEPAYINVMIHPQKRALYEFVQF